MKHRPWSDLEHGGASRSTHRMIQGRFGARKPAAHRYERRKVRESLRHDDWMLEADGVVGDAA